MGEKIILGYKKGALNNSYLASLYLDIFRLFRSCAAPHFRDNRIVMPLLSYRTRFCYFLCLLEIHNVYVTALPPHGGKTMKKNYEKNYKKKLCRVGGKSWTLAEVLPFSNNMHNKNLQFTYSPFTVIHVICTITNQSCNDAFINLTKPFVKDMKYFESGESGFMRALCEVFCDI